ncbi:MAG: molybdopterin molybdotransferase MoeA [Rhodoferax sp.]|nr:molybdopterin molybdotransferase MoeA [Rhodoferax sp.]
MSAPTRSPLLPLETAVAQLLEALDDRPLRIEMLSTLQADGRVLAQDVVSPLEVPPQDNSSMDGYALRCADLAPGRALPVSQRIPAGSQGLPLLAGTVARIFTGAPIPPGADAVVMQEDCQEVPGADPSAPQIHVQTQPLAGQWIRRRGEDVRLGATVLQSGMRLGPAALGMAASVGLAQLQVACKPRVALFSTGDELVMPGAVAPQDMPPGAIYNSNRFFLAALLRRMGCEVTDRGIVPDRLDATVQALDDAAQTHDLVLTSGGVSVGEEDHIKPAVQQLGRLDLWQIAIKPGKPFAQGRVGAAHFIGLPGNPVSSFVTFLLLVRPFVLRMQGVQHVALPIQSLRADFDWPRADRRQEFLRVRSNVQGGLDLFPNQSSGVLTSVVWGDGLVDNPPGRTIVRGDTVRFMGLGDLLG